MKRIRPILKPYHLSNERSHFAEWWLIEHYLRKQLDPSIVSGHVAKVLDAKTASKSLLVPGEIRVLAKEAAGWELCPVYVAVLAYAGAVNVWVAPFSSYGLPATPGEWLLEDRKDTITAVLSVEKAVEVPEYASLISWPAGRISEDQCAQAMALLHAMQNHRAPPASLIAWTGSPILDPRDPRHVHLKALDNLMDRLKRHQVPEVKGVSPVSIRQAIPYGAEMAMAASTGERTCPVLIRSITRKPGKRPSIKVSGRTTYALTADRITFKVGRTPGLLPQWRLVSARPTPDLASRFLLVDPKTMLPVGWGQLSSDRTIADLKTWHPGNLQRADAKLTDFVLVINRYED